MKHEMAAHIACIEETMWRSGRRWENNIKNVS